MERRTLVRLLVGLGIGVPVAIELATFLGLFEQRLLDGDGDPGGTPTPGEARVGVGDELLPASPPSDTVTGARVVAGEDAWTFELTVEVTGVDERPYELRLGDVTTSAGRSVDGGGSTGRVEPGGSATVVGRWNLPPGATPRTVEAVGIGFAADGGEPTTARRTVPLASVPVSGR